MPPPRAQWPAVVPLETATPLPPSTRGRTSKPPILIALIACMPRSFLIRPGEVGCRRYQSHEEPWIRRPFSDGNMSIQLPTHPVGRDPVSDSNEAAGPPSPQSPNGG